MCQIQRMKGALRAPKPTLSQSLHREPSERHIHASQRLKIFSVVGSSMGLSISKFTATKKRKSPSKPKARKKASSPAGNTTTTNAKNNGGNGSANVGRVSITSKVCTYNGGSDQWRCVHRQARTVKDLYNNNWDRFWVNNMPYLMNNNNTNEKSEKSQKPRKGK
jgi:hypothetical protein